MATPLPGFTSAAGRPGVSPALDAGSALRWRRDCPAHKSTATRPARTRGAAGCWVAGTCCPTATSAATSRNHRCTRYGIFRKNSTVIKRTIWQTFKKVSEDMLTAAGIDEMNEIIEAAFDIVDSRVGRENRNGEPQFVIGICSAGLMEAGTRSPAPRPP